MVLIPAKTAANRDAVQQVPGYTAAPYLLDTPKARIHNPTDTHLEPSIIAVALQALQLMMQ